MTRQALNYLAVIHVTGRKPVGMQRRGPTFLDVMRNCDMNIPACKHYVNTVAALELVAKHPLVVSFEALEKDGWVVDLAALAQLDRWTIRKGVYVRREGNRGVLRLNGKLLVRGAAQY